MPFKIYAYSDPYRLDQTHFWPEIKSAPHFCVSQTLTNALRELYEFKFESIVCTLDKILSVQYSGWKGNIERQIKQYAALSKALGDWKQSGKMSDTLYRSCKHNQRELLDGLRLFSELSLNPIHLHAESASREQRVFMALYEKVNTGELTEAFRFSEGRKDPREITRSILITTEQEKTDFLEESSDRPVRNLAYVKRKTDWYERILQELSKNSTKRVVVHGIHQFTPLQLRYIYTLHEAGVEVIFLINYQSCFKEIYKTWETVYQQFAVPIEQDQMILEYPCQEGSLSHALAKTMAGLFNPELNQGDYVLDRQELLNDVEFLEFDNVTEYANYVAGYFEKALVCDPKNPIRVMTEQVYSAGSEVKDLLRVYYPHYAGDRHFLAYPIGQFFAGLYRMWNPETEQLRLDLKSLRECLAAGILTTAPSEKLTGILQNTSLYFQDLDSYDTFMKRIEAYLENYDELHKAFGDLVQWVRQISVYNSEYVLREDLVLLRDTVVLLNQTAKGLFVSDDGDQESINFKLHFDKLEEFIRQQLPTSLVDEEEKNLVEELLERFDQVKSQDLGEGTMEDLRAGLYYYLQQKDKKRGKWIVRDFEQIDGDILRSRNQHRQSVEKDEPERTYHFACLSDQAMNQKADDLLPWPLTDYFMMKSYDPMEPQFRVYYTALGEYSKFLRYALFYGLYFNEGKVRLSYVRRHQDEIVQPYSLLRLMGIQPKRAEEVVDGVAKEVTDEVNDEVTEEKDLIAPIEPPPTAKAPAMIGAFKLEQAQDFGLCPYRYFLDYVFKGDVIPNSLFLYQGFYVNLLIDQVWQKIQNKPIAMESGRVRGYLDETEKKLARYFPFWRTVNDLEDLKSQASNYILKSGKLLNKPQFKKYDARHMKTRLLFKKAWFDYEFSEETTDHPYPAFNKIYQTSIEDSAIEYVSLYSLRDPLAKDQQQAMQDYIEVSTVRAEHPGVWCDYCTQKLICMKSFLRDDVHVKEE